MQGKIFIIASFTIHHKISIQPLGVFNGDHRFTLSHRDQWRFVPVPWTTYSGAYDRNILPYRSDKYFYGVGLNINYDRQGDAKLTLINGAINGAFHYLLNAKNILSLGANIGYATKGFDTKSLRWGNQWNGEVFNTNLDNQEGFQNTERVNKGSIFTVLLPINKATRETS